MNGLQVSRLVACNLWISSQQATCELINDENNYWFTVANLNI